MLLQIILILYSLNFLPTSQETQGDCEAGQYYNIAERKCTSCESVTYSNDGVEECTQCENGKQCMCDTTNPVHLADNSDVRESCLSDNGTLTCSMECYTHTRYAGSGFEGRISALINILDCTCNNRKTKESCEKRKSFTQTCFLNECDARGPRGRYYDDNTNITGLNVNVTTAVNNCFSDYNDTTGTCSKKECAEALKPYLLELASCNCYHIYSNEQKVTNSTKLKQCKERADFYKKIAKVCTRGEPLDQGTITNIIVIILVIVIVLLLVVMRWWAKKHLQHLKRSGKLIISNVDWTGVKPLGAAAAVLQRNRNPDVLHDKEILLKVRLNYSLLNLFGKLGWVLVYPQHVVLKIFSESQSEQQGVEMGIINKIKDKKLAKNCNIISVYGPERVTDNSDLVEFLGTLLKKSSTFQALRDVIIKNYLGGGVDAAQNEELPRCKYIAMNHCNELSLTKFIEDNPARLNIEMVKKLCVDLATALWFLHQKNIPSIVHCDLKPDNIFVKTRKKVHLKTSFILGDFGFAEVFEPSTAGALVFTQRGGTPSYVPPEWYLDFSHSREDTRLLDGVQDGILQKRAKFAPSIDIYAFGLILFIALHKKTEPWTDEFSEHWKNRDPGLKRQEFLKQLFTDSRTFKVRPICPDDASNRNVEFGALLTLAQDCWHYDCELRPSASQILDRDVLKSGYSRRRLRHQDIESVPHYHANGGVSPSVDV